MHRWDGFWWGGQKWCVQAPGVPNLEASPAIKLTMLGVFVSACIQPLRRWCAAEYVCTTTSKSMNDSKHAIIDVYVLRDSSDCCGAAVSSVPLALLHYHTGSTSTHGTLQTPLRSSAITTACCDPSDYRKGPILCRRRHDVCCAGWGIAIAEYPTTYDPVLTRQLWANATRAATTTAAAGP